MELPKRKNNRLKDYDYSSAGVYFITICSKDRKPVFSKIVGDGDHDVPRIFLYRYGEIIEKNLECMNRVYDYIKIDKYVIMPNHIHILMSVYNSGMSKSPSPTNETIPSFVFTFKRFVNKEAGENIFQRSYYDHIVRDERDYLSRWQYIENNPIKWEEDELIKDCVCKLPLA